MRKIPAHILCLLLAFSCGILSLSAQKQPTVQELNERISKAEESIRRSEALIKKVQKDKAATMSQLKLVGSRIASRRELVASLNSRISLLDKEISTKGRNIADLEKQSRGLKQGYAEMIRAAYKNQLINNSTAFIFASGDFNEATRRVDYMRRYNRMREVRVGEIDSLTREIELQILSLGEERNRLEETRRSRDNELQLLRDDEAGYKKSSRQLAAEEKKIAGTIKQKEKEKRNAEAQLRRIIDAEARKSSAKSKSLSAEDARRMAEISGRFDQNKGKFPYPVQGGVITDRYGKHPHPTQRGLTIDNKGVNIMAERGSSVRCLLDGTVTRVVFIKGLNNCVMIQHGDYFTVYSNLASVSVKANDKVKTNQIIGTIPGADDANDYYIHFELWRGTTNLNPEVWFYR